MEDKRHTRRTIRLLTRVHVLLMRGWTRGSFAKNRRGDTVDCRSKDAVRWCVRGALYRAGEQTRLRESVRDAERRISLAVNVLSLSGWNDRQRSAKPVRQAVRQVIADLRRELSA